MNQNLTLVTGANGFVGLALCKELMARGMRARGTTRSIGNFPYSMETVVVGDMDDSTNWNDALIGADVVIHLAARVHVMRECADDPLVEFRRANVAGTEQLAKRAATCGVKRFVYVSSVKVNGEEVLEGQGFTERDIPSPEDSYGISKWEAEQALHRIAIETGLEVVIVRPPLVYGAGVKGNFILMMNAIVRGFPLPFALVQNQRDLIYLDNLVDALIACATHPNAVGQTYLVSDGEGVSTPDLIRNLSKALGKRCFVFPFPVLIMKFLASLLGKSLAVDKLTKSLQVDSSKICYELGWKPPYTQQQGLQATAYWYLQSTKT